MKYIYSLATGGLNPFEKKSRLAVDFLKSCEGFYGVYPYDKSGRILWFYESENFAKIARNRGKAIGIEFGRNIGRFKVGADGIPEFDKEV